MLPRLALPIPALGLALAALLVASACAVSGGSLLSELHLSSPVVEPTGTGSLPPVAVSYTLSRPATISAYLTSGSGDKLYLRHEEARPVAGEYVLAFNGAYAPDPTGDERRVLPTGRYSLVVEARDAAGVRARSTAELQVRDADVAPPAVESLTLFPGVISPNFDGSDDITRITYRTTKKATTTLYLLSDSGKRYVLAREERQPPGEHATTWDGQIGNQLLPSGSYAVVAEARDAAGNVATARSPLQIDASSVPDVRILAVSFEPRRVLLGGTLRVEVRVKNTGTTVLRTHGPDPGHTYSSQEVFSTVAEGAFREQRGLWRVGVDWAVAPGTTGSRYPYRWGFGRDLQPGEEATVVGYLRLEHRYPRLWLHAGLIQEQVRYWDNEVGRTAIEIGY